MSNLTKSEAINAPAENTSIIKNAFSVGTPLCRLSAIKKFIIQLPINSMVFTTEVATPAFSILFASFEAVNAKI